MVENVPPTYIIEFLTRAIEVSRDVAETVLILKTKARDPGLAALCCQGNSQPC